MLSGGRAWRIGLVMISCAVLVSWMIRHRILLGAQRIRLSDGSVLRPGNVGFGEPFRIRTANGWRDYVGELVPEPWARKLGAKNVKLQGTNTVTVVLVTEILGSNASGELRAATVDEHGCELGITAGSGAVFPGLNPLKLFEFAEFPRADTQFSLRLYENISTTTSAKWTNAGEFPIRNRRRASPPAWKAEALPITRKVEGAEFTLVELKNGARPLVSPVQSARAGESIGAVLRFLLRPYDGWELAAFVGVSDRFGQRMGQGGYVAGLLPGGVYEVSVQSGLCVEETWKVEAEFSKVVHFASNELWTIARVPLPRRGQTSFREVRTNFCGEEFVFKAIAGPDSTESRTWKSMMRDVPVAQIVCRRLPERAEIRLVRAIDDEGQEVSIRSRSSDPPDYYFGLEVRNEPRTVDLTFAVSKRIRVTYFVKPRQFSREELGRMTGNPAGQ